MRLIFLANFELYDGKYWEGDRLMPWLYAGLRNQPFYHLLADSLGKYYDILKFDISKCPVPYWEKTQGISNVLKFINFTPKEDDIIFYIQNQSHYSNDIVNPIFYFHIDGAVVFNTQEIELGFRRWSRDYYPVGKKHITVPLWVFPELHDPTKKKTNFLADINRNNSLEEYKETMETSKYVLIKGDWVSNRVFEAMASKTIPLIITWKVNKRFKDMKTKYREMGLKDGENCYFIDLYDWRRDLIINEYDEEMAQKGYDLVMKEHTFSNRVDIFRREIDNYMNSISKT